MVDHRRWVLTGCAILVVILIGLGIAGVFNIFKVDYYNNEVWTYSEFSESLIKQFPKGFTDEDEDKLRDFFNIGENEYISEENLEVKLVQYLNSQYKNLTFTFAEGVVTMEGHPELGNLTGRYEGEEAKSIFGLSPAVNVYFTNPETQEEEHFRLQSYSGSGHRLGVEVGGVDYWINFETEKVS